MSTERDFNPAGGYLRELKKRGLVGERGATGSEPRRWTISICDMCGRQLSYGFNVADHAWSCAGSFREVEVIEVGSGHDEQTEEPARFKCDRCGAIEDRPLARDMDVCPHCPEGRWRRVTESGKDEQADPGEFALRLVALALGLGFATDCAAGDVIPQETWTRLDREGLLQTTRDMTDEYVTSTTVKGEEHLIEALAALPERFGSSVSGGE